MTDVSGRRSANRRAKRRFPVRALRLAALAALAPLLADPPAALPGIPESDQAYIQGRQMSAAGREVEAIRAFERAVAENPANLEARYQIALLQSRNIATYPEAEAGFTALPELAMKGGEKGRDDLIFRAGVGLGKLYLQMGRNEQAIQVLRGALASAPRGSAIDEAHNNLGIAFYYERLYDEGIFELRRAIKANPRNVDAKFNLKTIRSRLEHFQAGKLYSRMGDRKSSVEEFRKAIELDPRFVEARQRLGMELLAEGRHEEALRELRRAELISPRYRKIFEIWYGEGLALKGLGRGEEALKAFRRTAEARPRFAEAHNEIGKILVEKGDFDGAAQSFATAIGIDPRTEYARNLQATFLRQPATSPPR